MADDISPVGPRRLRVPSGYPYPDLTTIISDHDMMYADGHDLHYANVGLSALEMIHDAIRARGADGVERVLDLPCGHGRVTRVLRAAFPEAELYVSDIDVDAVTFCQENFGAAAKVSQPDFRTLRYEERFDVIWIGSLLTHLPPDTSGALIEFAIRHLSGRGVAVVSSHGAFVAGRIQAALLLGGEAYGTPNDTGMKMISDYFTLGYGYADYPNVDMDIQRYGVSLSTAEWITASVAHFGGRTLFYRSHAWDNHHDVVAFGRAE